MSVSVSRIQKGVKKRLGLKFDARFPALNACPHEDLKFVISVHPKLAREPELTQYAILFQSVVLHLTHRRLFARDGDAARRYFAWPPQRWLPSTPFCSDAKASLTPSGTSNASKPLGEILYVLIARRIPSSHPTGTHLNLLRVKRMLMRKKLVVGNWKMNMTRSQATAAVESLVLMIDPQSDVEVAICPTFLTIEVVSHVFRRTHFRVGAQDVFWMQGGAFTGNISASCLQTPVALSASWATAETRRAGLESWRFQNRRCRILPKRKRR